MVAVFVVPMWFAKRGEQAGFSALGALDRLVSPGLEPLASLAAAAAVTERVPLRTTVLLAPYRLNAVLLAKEAASVHVISGGRLTLGLGVGWREDDYEASGTPYSERGRKLDEMLLEIKRVWSGYEYGFAGGIGPDVIGDPPKLLLGGQVKRSYSRAAEHGIGWILGGGTPDQFAEGREHLERAWEDAGREGKPFGAAMGYFSLGDRAEQNARGFLDHYYAALGEETVNAIVASTPKDPETVKNDIRAFTEAGVTSSSSSPAHPIRSRSTYLRTPRCSPGRLASTNRTPTCSHANSPAAYSSLGGRMRPFLT